MRMGPFKNIDKEMAELAEWLKKKQEEDRCPFDEVETEEEKENESDNKPS